MSDSGFGSHFLDTHSSKAFLRRGIKLNLERLSVSQNHLSEFLFLVSKLGALLFILLLLRFRNFQSILPSPSFSLEKYTNMSKTITTN